ncbi:MAG TPA: helix-turn-helix transcriptional regulator [Pseudogracilibacillus sp.]|nr:helix-turn-helix transcriptional regulator [Pseudogracilibacillus sp.]
MGSLSPGEHLKNIRSKYGLTQKEISEVLGVSKSYYTKLEGEFKKPSYKFLCKVKQSFKEIDMNKFF